MQFAKLRSGPVWPPLRALLRPTTPTPMPGCGNCCFPFCCIAKWSGDVEAWTRDGRSNNRFRDDNSDKVLTFETPDSFRESPDPLVGLKLDGTSFDITAKYPKLTCFIDCCVLTCHFVGPMLAAKGGGPG